LVVRAGRDLTVRDLPLQEIVKAVVQVEFSPPAQAELELAGRTAGTEAGA
jgi:ribosome maturation factor RimP